MLVLQIVLIVSKISCDDVNAVLMQPTERAVFQANFALWIKLSLEMQPGDAIKLSFKYFDVVFLRKFVSEHTSWFKINVNE